MDLSRAAGEGQRQAADAEHDERRGRLRRPSVPGDAQPDGQGSHWLKVTQALREAAGAEVGDIVALEIAPVEVEPEPRVPVDLRKALTANVDARATWTDITPVARCDWIHWITSGKQAETRARRIRTACDMLASGKRRACCFDRSGIYSKGFSAPEATE